MGCLTLSSASEWLPWAHRAFLREPARTVEAVSAPAPAVEEQQADASTDVSGADDATRGARILIVEDNYAILQAARAILESADFEVRVARDAPEAVEIVAAGVPVDLALIDLGLPEGDGRRLATQVTAHSPATKILYMSGYPAEAVLDWGVAPAGDWFLEKPFTHEQLVERVQSRLRD